jgi:ubiquinone/menaquinone biosynthesis C-methylase UbiE
MSDIDRAILDFYSKAPEEHRLQQGVFQLEKARTRELIARHLPPSPATVYDVGGAAGAYAFWLAEQSYEVHLLDATQRLVDEARRRDSAAPAKLASCQVGDARLLPFADGSARAVLLLGPLYHLVHAEDRHRALCEAARVLVPGGVLIASAISRWASALDGAMRDRLADPDFASIVEQDVKDGQHRNPTGRLDYFTTAYFHRPADLRQDVERAGLTVEALYGIEGPGWLFGDFEARWADAERRSTLLQLAALLERVPDVAGCSAHLLVVARTAPS